jgi:hypothetical protein
VLLVGDVADDLHQDQLLRPVGIKGDTSTPSATNTKDVFKKN